MELHESILCYDIEVYPNYFTVFFLGSKVKERFSFRDEIDLETVNKIKEFIKGKVLIGWNNLEYDNPMMDFLLKMRVSTTKELKQLSNAVINGEFPHKEIKKITLLKDFGCYTIDLMKIVLGNVRKSLKATMIHYKWHTIEDLPYPHDSILTENEISHVDRYNENDVEMVVFLVKKFFDKIKLRTSIKKKYGLDSFVLSESDSGISNVLMELLYSEKTGLNPYSFKFSKSSWKTLTLEDVFLPLFRFEHPIFSAFYEKISSCVFVKNGKVLTDKDIQSQTGVLSLPYEDYTLNLQFGSGGLHSIDEADYFESKEDEYIVDDDVESYYPSIVINRSLNPHHLQPVISEIFKEKKAERIKAKKEKDETTNSANKMILNSTTGKFNSEFSFLFDQKLYLQITVNCQLQTIKLIEMLYQKGIRIISANTDGVTSIVHKDKKAEYDQIVEEWRNIFGYNMEQKIYSKYIRSNVNNYCAYIPSENKWKKKGWFEIEKDVHKGYEYPVVTRAFFQYLINPTENPKEFLTDFFKKHLEEHGVHEFCLSQIISKEFKNYLRIEREDRTDIVPLQKTLRYYISKGMENEGVLVKSKLLFNTEKKKVFYPFLVKHTRYHAKNMVTIYNSAFESEDYKVDFDFYVEEAMKVIEPIIKRKNEKVFAN